MQLPLRRSAVVASLTVSLLLLLSNFILRPALTAAGSTTNTTDTPKDAVPALQQRLTNAYGQLPLVFEANAGQFDPRVQFVARGAGYRLALRQSEAVLHLRGTEREAQVRLGFSGARATARVSGLSESASKSHYFLGSDQQAWRTNVAHFAKVKVESIYPGVDVIWYGQQQQLEYDLLIAPGTQTKQIRLALTGADALELDEAGALLLRFGHGATKQAMRMLKPVAWQDVNGVRRQVDCAYRLDRQGRVRFRLGAYDRRLPLVIDPVLAYSTFLGGSNLDSVQSLAVDSEGNAYITGTTNSTDFPGPSAIQQMPSGGTDVFVVKLNPTGTALVWGAWLGGSLQDTATKLSVDDGGNVYITGYTLSNNFPLRNALQTTRKGTTDSFIAKFSPNGATLLYSTLLGGTGSEYANGLAIDMAGNIYLAGSTDSADFPVQNALQANRRGHALYVSTNAGAQWTGAALTAAEPSLSALNVNDLAFDPSNSMIVYAATDRGLYKSVNGGTAWTQISGTQPPLIFSQIIPDPRTPQTLYAVGLSRLYKSTDGGQTWALMTYPVSLLQRLAIAATTPTTFFAFDILGMRKSTDGGQTWTQFTPSFNNGERGEVIVVDPLTSTTIYLGTNRQMYKSVDGGLTWHFAGQGLLNNSSPNFSALAISAGNTQVLYTVQIGSGLYRTLNGGASWSPAKLPSDLFFSFAGQVAIDPTNPLTIYLSSRSIGSNRSGVYKSIDGGETWTALGNGLVSRAVRAVLISKDLPQRVLAGGICRTGRFCGETQPHRLDVVVCVVSGRQWRRWHKRAGAGCRRQSGASGNHQLG